MVVLNKNINMRRSLGWCLQSTYPSQLCGLLLLFAFSAKSSDPFLLNRSLVEPTYLMAAALDLILGSLLLVSTEASMVHMIGGIVFGLYFLVQMFNFWLGEPDCGCFGEIPSDVSYVGTIDIFASCLLFCCFYADPSRPFASRQIISKGIILSATLVLFLAIAIPLTREKQLLEQTEILDCERVPGTPWYRLKVRYRNPFSEEVKIVGSKRHCSYVVSNASVQIVPAKNSADCEFLVRGTGSKDFLKGSVLLFIERSGKSFFSSVRYFAPVKS